MARKKTNEEKEYAILTANVRELLKLKAGRDVLWHILAECNLYGVSFADDNHLNGKRAIGVFILQMLEDADPTAYPRLLLDKQKEGAGKNGTDRNDTDS